MSESKTGTQFDGTPQFPIAFNEIGRGEIDVDLTEGRMSFSQVFIKRDRLARGFFGFTAPFDRRDVAARSEVCIGIGQAGVGKSVIAIFANSVFAKADGGEHVIPGTTMDIRSRLHV